MVLLRGGEGGGGGSPVGVIQQASERGREEKKDKSGKRVLAANLPRLEYIATGMAERNIVPRTETAALKAPSRREVWLNYRKATKCQH